MLESISFYLLPFFKNLSILHLTVFLLFLGAAIKRTGLEGFSLSLWLSENKGRFQIGSLFIWVLSTLMALTDVSPLFDFFGFNINASPVGLGLAIAAVLGLATTKVTHTTKKSAKAKEIQTDANKIVKSSAEIIESEKQSKEQ